MGSWRLTTKLPARGTQVPLGHTSPEPHCTVPRSERCNYEDHNKKKVKENANNLVQHTLHWQGPVYDSNSSLTSSLGASTLSSEIQPAEQYLVSPKQECVLKHFLPVEPGLIHPFSSQAYLNLSGDIMALSRGHKHTITHTVVAIPVISHCCNMAVGLIFLILSLEDLYLRE